jgi:hypothetical protein
MAQELSDADMKVIHDCAWEIVEVAARAVPKSATAAAAIFRSAATTMSRVDGRMQRLFSDIAEQLDPSR